MARKPLTKEQSRQVFLCWMYIFIFIAVLVATNFVFSSHFGISVQFGPPDHDNPFRCSQHGALQCTTKKGKCTNRKQMCVFPDRDYQCLHLMFKRKLTSDKLKKMKTKYTDQAILLQKMKIFEKYCANDKIRLYKQMQEDLSSLMLGFELFICTILFGIFYEEFRNIAHYMAFN